MGDRFGNLTIDGDRFIKDLKVIELRAELEQRGLSKYGNKKELVQRLSIFEENRQKSTGQPNQETPNQWLENEADLNNDFLREYFKSQKALFQEQVQRKNQIGVSSEPPQESPSPPVSKDSSVQFKDVPNYQVSGLSSSAPVTIGTASTIVTSATPPKKSPGRKKKEAKDFKHKQVIASKSSYDADASLLSSRPSRTSAQASRALSLASFEDDDDDDDSEEKESYDPYSFAHKPRKRGQHKGPRGSHLRRLSGVYNSDPSFKPTPIEEKTVSRETPIHNMLKSSKC
ncbi:hypothetical protein Avbf_00926 [Armadillidium vulgare]|nr:hypothetical protein Avbf_00926 [Armadillidium vulgare]